MNNQISQLDLKIAEYNYHKYTSTLFINMDSMFDPQPNMVVNGNVSKEFGLLHSQSTRGIKRSYYGEMKKVNQYASKPSKEISLIIVQK